MKRIKKLHEAAAVVASLQPRVAWAVNSLNKRDIKRLSPTARDAMHGLEALETELEKMITAATLKEKDTGENDDLEHWSSPNGCLKGCPACRGDDS